MKKHTEADALAARLAAAANQPLVAVSTPTTASVDAEAPKTAGSETTLAIGQPTRRRRKSKSKAVDSDQFEDDTVPMSIRPRREVLTRYVIAAAERTREVGRVISAQEMMLERLEGGP